MRSSEAFFKDLSLQHSMQTKEHWTVANREELTAADGQCHISKYEYRKGWWWVLAWDFHIMRLWGRWSCLENRRFFHQWEVLSIKQWSPGDGTWVERHQWATPCPCHQAPARTSVYVWWSGSTHTSLQPENTRGRREPPQASWHGWFEFKMWMVCFEFQFLWITVGRGDSCALAVWVQRRWAHSQSESKRLRKHMWRKRLFASTL